MLLKIRGVGQWQVRDYAEASETYVNVRDGYGRAAYSFPSGRIIEDGKIVASVSYNGRVWASLTARDWTPEEKPIYDNLAVRP